MTASMTILRLSFILLFGAMSVMHGPVMTFSGAHAATAEEHHHAGHSNDIASDCHEDQAPPATHGKCNAFACLMAVEPYPVMTRPLSSILFAVMAAAPMTSFEPLRLVPALPPPRIQG